MTIEELIMKDNLLYLSIHKLSKEYEDLTIRKQQVAERLNKIEKARTALWDNFHVNCGRESESL